MGQKIDKFNGASLNHSDVLGVLCLALGGFSFFILLFMLLLSLGPLISTRGRAWEYDLVRDMFIGSLIVFVFLVVSPLVTAYSLLRKRKWAKAPVIMGAIILLLVGLLFMASAISMGWYGGIIFPALCLALSGYAFWTVYRRALSNNSFNASGNSSDVIRGN